MPVCAGYTGQALYGGRTLLYTSGALKPNYELLESDAATGPGHTGKSHLHHVPYVSGSISGEMSTLDDELWQDTLAKALVSKTLLVAPHATKAIRCTSFFIHELSVQAAPTQLLTYSLAVQSYDWSYATSTPWSGPPGSLYAIKPIAGWQTSVTVPGFLTQEIISWDLGLTCGWQYRYGTQALGGATTAPLLSDADAPNLAVRLRVTILRDGYLLPALNTDMSLAVSIGAHVISFVGRLSDFTPAAPDPNSAVPYDLEFLGYGLTPIFT